MHRSARRLLAGALAAVLTATVLTISTLKPAPARAATPIQPPASVVASLNPAHPRLLATAADFTTATQRLTTDTRLQGWMTKLRAQADAIVSLPVSTYKLPTDANMLTTAREVKRRVYTLAAVYRLTGDTAYADRAVQELTAISAFPDWNPSHFLDVGELANAAGIGYDWLYDYMTADQRTVVRTAIETKALQPALVLYAQSTSVYSQSHNWNLVCNAVAIAALAIGDEDSTEADQVLKDSITSIQNGISEYGPDGAYNESPDYWEYATEYLVDYLAAFNTAVGTDYGLSGLPGISGTGDYGIDVTGPLGQTFNYGDGAPDFLGGVTAGWQVPQMMWLADRYQRSEWASWEAERADLSPSPLDILWYDPSRTSAADHPAATDAYFHGVELATARSAWDDPYAVSVAFKGQRAGYDQVAGHANLDAGDFVLDAGGVRWFEEQGADNYGLPGYFDWQKDTGGRFDYYATRPEGQNTMQLGNGPVPSTALTNGAPIIATGSQPRDWYAVTDLTGQYGGTVQRAQRGIQMFDDRRQVLVQDEIQTSAPTDYWSFLQTRADVVVAADGKSATLYRGGQRLWIQLLTPGSGQILVGDATPLPASPNPAGQSTFPGLRRLMVHLSGVTSATVALRMVPLGAGEQPPTDTVSVVPLASWAAGSVGSTALTGIVVGAGQLAGFDPQRYRYDVTVPWSATSVPQVAPLSASGTYSEVTQATGIPGTATIRTFQLDANYQKVYGPTYQVHFRQDGATSAASLPIAAVSASSDDGDPATNTIDGNSGSRWSAAGDGQYISYDLGASRTVGAVALAFFSGFARSTTFDVLTSTDGSTWSTALSGAVSAGTSDNAQVFSFSPRTARYVRIVGHGNSVSTYNSITETRIYPSAASAQSDLPPQQVVLASVTATPTTVSNLLVGSTAQVTLSGQNSDGTAANLSTATVTWASNQPTVAGVNGTGLVTAAGAGSASIGALVVQAPAVRISHVPVTVTDPSHIEPAADTSVRDGTYADTTYGSATALEVRNNPALNSGYDRVTYLRFPTSAIHGTVTAASLNLFGGIDDGSTGSTVVGVYAVADTGWSEAAMTWNTRPAMGDELSDVTLDGTAGWRTADLTAYAQAQQAAGKDIAVAVASEVTGYGPHVAFNSKEASTNHPYLQLTVS